MPQPVDVLSPVHPGEILAEEFLRSLGISQYRLAQAIGVPLPRINAIVRGKRGISADTARRLARFFGTSVELWINLQSHFELETSRRTAPELEAAIEPWVTPKGSAPSASGAAGRPTARSRSDRASRATRARHPKVAPRAS